MATTENIKTRFFILSDTHGMTFNEDFKLPSADVAIHCGDLTDGSKMEEFRAAIRLLQEIDAPLKLVIAGTHDFTLDAPVFQQKVADVSRFADTELINKEYGDHEQVRQLVEEASEGSSGVVFLDEGIYYFILDNGALLTVYASPWTPSLGDWGFQYHPERGHDFTISEGVDIVMSHGPPRGIVDYTNSRQIAGCPDLFAAVARVRPQIALLWPYS